MKSYETFEYSRPRSRSGVIWGILTVLTLLGVICVTGGFLVIFTNPYSELNPFPPATLPPPLLLPSPTPTDAVYSLPPTWTPTYTVAPLPSETPLPTATLPPTPTPITITPTPTNTPIPPLGGYPFRVVPAIQKRSQISITRN